jgi:hypothetical protein
LNELRVEQLMVERLEGDFQPRVIDRMYRMVRIGIQA